MTSRPTQAEVDECMRMAREEQFGADDPTVYMRVLAAEVQALRKDLHTAVDAFYGASGREQGLRAAITRVEMLYAMAHEDRLIRVGDIRAALRGEP